LLFRVKNIPEGRILPFSSDLVKPEARVVAIGFSPFHIPGTEFRGVINAPTIIPSTIM
jgi:hypothetical protein